MKEYDFRDRKWIQFLLKWGMNYDSYARSEIKDGCSLFWHLVGSVLMVLVKGLVGAMVVIALLGFVIVTLSWLTLFLPESMYASVDLIETGLILTTIILVTMLIFGYVEFKMNSNFKLLPTYITKHLPEDFLTKKDSEEDKAPNKHWEAFKVLWRSFKDKTCVKVKV